ncbi:Peptide chain release factor 1, mitochondrial [Ophidiomyces ophidiicola]|uniref:Peptide chain release factor 1, mitochondrial n=1 Tax=Ophidiomyces ophidiicola TaxID=1387563 RepID=A0ACB8UM08_9EURO|nr:Peptide chain release factor 1, mitochondrial [Ophidiomyces ophidiicola]KAI1976944.1 Peptide chain release factor 1, mitochondrial [Ophidiomyces ophidiicola]KAI1983116.1 Peptide chain release factor 1, mitochondrial [Ophidiomyces ophidiicola]KAI2006439.1 Peptide chain release factor 1, mitochondrial [Ophidiomyces ophidiicola]KAI2014458.1 Peptide chain release factor 1, mitochondrial [Ophidiomyces ophidiicola]
MFSASQLCSRCLTYYTRLSRQKYLRRWRRSYSTVQPLTILTPALLNRARSLANEHATLSGRLTDNFQKDTAKRVGELAQTVQILKEWDRTNEIILELNSLLSDPASDLELRELASEDLETTTSSLSILSEKLKESLVPRHPFAELPCLIEIRPGAGGDEASLFASELLRMYLAFCSRRGFKTTILKRDIEDGCGGNGSENRLSEAVLEVETAGSYDVLRTEAGVHRVQRVPATETKGRVHTSAVSVMVLPSLSELGEHAPNLDDPNSDYYISMQDVQFEKMRASGAGGQHVNKTESAIRLTHTPTGTIVSVQDSRSQHENRRRAWQLLRAKVAQLRREAREQELVELRRSVMGGVAKMGRGDKIRTYNFGQSRCTDHRSGITVYNLGGVLDGDEHLGEIMESVRTWLVSKDLDTLSAEERLK